MKKRLTDWQEYLSNLEKEEHSLSERYEREVRALMVNPSFIRSHEEFGDEFQRISREKDFALSHIALAKLNKFDLDIGSSSINPALWDYHEDDDGNQHPYLSELGHIEARKLLRSNANSEDLRKDARWSRWISVISLAIALAAILFEPFFRWIWPPNPSEVIILQMPEDQGAAAEKSSGS